MKGLQKKDKHSHSQEENYLGVKQQYFLLYKRLIDYYVKNRLHRFSLEKLKSFQKKIFYDGLTELKEMDIKSCVPVLVKILNKEKDAETIERIDDALLTLSPENPSQ